MELTKDEFAAIQEAVITTKTGLAELGELQLATVGGGCGEVVFG